MHNIQKTEDYNLFKRMEGNRTLNKAHVSRLAISFAENPELAAASPIIVNGNNEVVDGQHRLQALINLGLPVYYHQVGNLDLRSVQVLNSATKNWNPVDYARSFSEMGNENYKTYLEFKFKYHLTHEVLVQVLTQGKRLDSAIFTRGKFKVKNLTIAHRVSQQLVDIRQYYKRGDKKVFASAFMRISLTPEYDHKRMIAKVKQFNSFFQDSPNVEEYMRQLEKIYNHHVRDNERVRFF
jgi:ASC-1-like (ASCH) protein